MSRFLDGIRLHWLASSLFVAYWALAYLLHVVRWHAPKETGDIAPPVLLLHLLLPFVAGLLAAWWRGPHAGRILYGLLAGAAVLLVDSVFIFLPDVVASARGDARGGDELMEIPVWLAAASLVGAVLGSAGAAGGAVAGGRIPRAERGTTAAPPPRILLTASGLAFSVAVMILIAVIPAVSADTSPGATPDRAVPALGIMAVLEAGAGLAFLAAKSMRSGWANRPLAAGTALLVFALGAVLAAAGSAAAGHSHFGLGTVGLVVSALGNTTAGILAFVAVFRRNAETGIQGDLTRSWS